jgi:hypothetical protein
MFILIIVLYVLMAITTVLLVTTGYQGLARISVIEMTHPTLGLFTIMVFALTESFALTFISAMIKSLKQKIKEAQFEILSKSRLAVYRHGMVSVLWITIVFLLGGAVDTDIIPPFFHGMIFLLGFGHYFFVLKLQHRAIGDFVLMLNELNFSKDNYNDKSE